MDRVGTRVEELITLVRGLQAKLGVQQSKPKVRFGPLTEAERKAIARLEQRIANAETPVKRKGNCFTCGAKGHWKSQCPSALPAATSNPALGASPNSV